MIYSGATLNPFRNTTDGSRWIVKIQPTQAGLLTLPEYHRWKPVDRSGPAYSGATLNPFRNTTGGAL